jgi:hypothetical protein
MKLAQKPIIPEVPEEHFLKVKQEAEEKYKKLQPVYCPYLKDKVHFDTTGLDHIKFKEWNKTRIRTDQYIRLKLLYLVPEIIAKSHTVQGFSDDKGWVRRKRHGKWEKILMNINYWEFVAVIGKVRIKVIVKQVEGGQKHFRSIIPFWKMDKEKNIRKLYDSDIKNDGDLEGEIE